MFGFQNDLQYIHIYNSYIDIQDKHDEWIEKTDWEKTDIEERHIDRLGGFFEESISISAQSGHGWTNHLFVLIISHTMFTDIWTALMSGTFLENI